MKIKKPWHNRRNRKRNINRKQALRSCDTLTFQEPEYTSSAPVSHRSRFRPDGTPGTKPQAVILDMDGTLENWDGHPNPVAMEYAERHHSEGRVLVIVTARDHDWSYQRTHDWLRKHLHLPFVGPICRPNDDERYACDFKKAIYDQLSAVYDIVSAIDDDHYVLGMWNSIEGLEVVATGYDYQIAKGQRRTGVYTGWDRDDAEQSWRTLPDRWNDRWDTYEPADHDDDEYEWVQWYESEVQRAKRRQPRPPIDWEREIEELEECCERCDHPWYHHTVEGCGGSKHCNCDG